MYAVIEQDLFGHRSVYEAQNFDDAYNWLDGLSKVHCKKYKIIRK